MSWLDLHLHSSASLDGEVSPRGLAELCRQEKLELASLTDHNTTSGVNEFMWRGAQLGLRTVPGIELDCMLNEEIHLHVLGYGIDTTSAALCEIEESVRQKMRQASQRQMDAVEQLGIRFDRDAVLAQSRNGAVAAETIAESALSDPANRAHPLIRPLLDGDLSKRPLVNFYWLLCAPGKPAYVPVTYIPAPQAIAAIHTAGGLAVLAHPGATLGMDKGLAETVLSLPFDGVEVFSSYHNAEMTAFYWTLAEKRGLLMTGGSDFHGKIKPDIRPGKVNYYNREHEIRDTLLAAIAAGPPYQSKQKMEERKMYAFEYTITDPIGLHARPAGELAKEVKKYASKVFLSKGDKRTDVSRLMAVMAMGVKTGDTVRVEVEGDDAEQVGPQVEAFFKEKF